MMTSQFRGYPYSDLLWLWALGETCELESLATIAAIFSTAFDVGAKGAFGVAYYGECLHFLSPATVSGVGSSVIYTASWKWASMVLLMVAYCERID